MEKEYTFSYTSGAKQRKVLENRVKDIFKIHAPSLWYEILDVDLEFRIVSMILTENRRLRYYVRYGISVVYKYEQSVNTSICGNLVDIKMYKFYKDGKTRELKQYVTFLRSLLLIFLPSHLKLHEVEYQVKFINSYPPFEDEAYETIRQETVFDENWDYVPRAPRFGYFVLLINGTEYVCRITSASGHFEYYKRAKDEQLMAITSWVHLTKHIIAMTKKEFMEKSLKWEYLELLLGRVTRRPFDDINANKLETGTYMIGHCGDVFLCQEEEEERGDKFDDRTILNGVT